MMKDATRRRDLAAVWAVYERDGRATIRAVQRELGLRQPGRVLHRLRQLRDEGLVAFDDGRNGTLRPVLQPEDRVAPTDRQRPGESIPEWCRRLDSYENAPSARTTEAAA